MSGALTPGFDGTFAGTVTRLWPPSSDFMSATNSLKPSMPTSPLVVPSLNLPKIATTSRRLSSQTLLYSGNLPVVWIGLGDSDAFVVNVSVSDSLQPDAFGRKK